MARTDTGAQLTVAHRNRQLRLRAVTLSELLALWPAWNPSDPATWEAFATGALVLGEARHRNSAGLAADYYTTFRAAEQVDGAATPRLARWEPDRVRTSLEVTGRASVAKSLQAGRGVGEAQTAALVQVSGALTRHVLDGGRDTLIGSTQADRQARGWQRVTAGSPCAFCVMLSSRGPVYKESSGDFQAHDHCACSVEPVYSGGEWGPSNVAHRELWDTHAASSADPLNALRRALA